MTILLRLPVVLLVLARGGILGHLVRTGMLPGWLAGFFRSLDGVFSWGRRDRPGIALARALSRLGPGFIKFGQALSTRADLIGAEAAADLATLQDRLAPFSPALARRMIAKELDQPLDTVFAHFDDTPVAAASIAQVHFASLTDGREVAVKILRPGIRRRVEKDIRFFRAMAGFVELIAPATRRLRLVHAVDQFAYISDVELDLRLEGAAAGKLADNHREDDGIHVPWIEWKLTTEHMLVMERIEGTRIDDREALKAAGHDIDTITRTAARCFFVQVFRDGYFHADMHPGNIFIRDDGVLVPIDFGIMGDLSLPDRLFLARLLNAMLDRDYSQVASLHAEAGMISPAVSREGFAQAVRAVTEPVMDKPMGEVSLGTVLGQIFGLARRFDISVQPQFTLLQKTMVMAEGVGRQLNPDANMWPLARDLAEDWARSQQSLSSQLSEIADKALLLGLRLPDLLDKAEKTLDRLAATPPEHSSMQHASRPGFPWGWLGIIAGIVIIFHIL